MEQAPQKTWAGKTKSRGCPLCEDAARVYGALLWVNVQLVESLWVRNREEAGKADTVMGCCYRPCGYGEEMDRVSLNFRVFLVTRPGGVFSSWGTCPCWMGSCGTQPVGGF